RPLLSTLFPYTTLFRSSRLEINEVDARVTNRVVIEAKDITVTYRYKGNSFNALNGVSFQIYEGEVVGIIGHNGAGKSTLCKTMRSEEHTSELQSRENLV